MIPGVGPATAERLRRVGVHTVADLETVTADELVRLRRAGARHRRSTALARADDDRPVVAERETKSVSVEGTYDTDLTDRRLLEGLLDRQAGEVAERLRKARLSGRTVTIKVRLHDFTTLSRSSDPARPDRRRRGDRGPAGPGAARPTSTPPAASGCSASASPGWPTGSRRTCSATTTPEDDGSEAAPSAVELAAAARARHLGARAWTSCTPSTAAAGSGAPGAGVVTVRFETAETPARAGAHVPRPTTRRSCRSAAC